MTDQSITTRRAERRDEDGLFALWRELLDEQSALDSRFRVAEDVEERWRNDFRLQLKQERRRVFVAERDGALAGFINAVRSAPPPIYELASEVYIEEVYVRPEARGSEVGSGLLAAVREWAHELGADRLRLSALAENADGRAFWERQGAKAFSVNYTIELESAGKSAEASKKTRLGF